MIAPYSGRVTVDLGTGDGRFVYYAARRDSDRLFVGIDPVGEAMAGYSRRAGKKPDRGGAVNALFVIASLEALPRELDAAADQLTVFLPWGSLLRAVALPDPAGLALIGRLCRPGAILEVLLAYDSSLDPRAKRLGLPPLSVQRLRAALPVAYATGGFEATSVERATPAQVAALDTTWSRRLARGRPRDFWRILARRQG